MPEEKGKLFSKKKPGTGWSRQEEKQKAKVQGFVEDPIFTANYYYPELKNYINRENVDSVVDETFSGMDESAKIQIKEQLKTRLEQDELNAQVNERIEQEERERKYLEQVNRDIKDYAPGDKDSPAVKQLFKEGFDEETLRISDEYKEQAEDRKRKEELDAKTLVSRTRKTYDENQEKLDKARIGMTSYGALSDEEKERSLKWGEEPKKEKVTLSDGTTLEFYDSPINSVGTPGAATLMEKAFMGVVEYSSMALNYTSSLISESLSSLFTDSGLTSEESIERDKLDKKIKATERPAASRNFQQSIAPELKKDIAELFGNSKEGDFDYVDVDNIPDTPEEFSKWVKDVKGEKEYNIKFERDKIPTEQLKNWKEIKKLLDNYETASDRYEEFINGSDNSILRAISGIGAEKVAALNVISNINKMSLVKSLEGGEDNLTPLEKAELKSLLINEQSKGINSDFAFGVGQTISGSMQMMGEQIINMKLLNKIPGVKKLVSAILSGAVSPSALAEASSAYLGQVQRVDNPMAESGESFVMSEKQKLDLVDAMKSYMISLNETANNIKVLEYELSRIDKQLEGDITEDGIQVKPEDEKTLKERKALIESNLERAQDTIDSLVDEDGNVLLDNFSLLESGFKGGLAMGTESFIEAYSPVIFNKIGKALRLPPANEIALKMSKYNNRVGRVAGKLDRFGSRATNLYEKGFIQGTGLGRLARRIKNYSGPDSIIGNIWEEMGEEGINQLIPQYKEDYGDQLAELINSDFWATVILSTGPTVMGMKGIGLAANSLASSGLTEEQKKERSEFIRAKNIMENTYRSFSETKIGEGVADVIAMTAPGVLFKLPEYRGKIADLRNLDKEYHNDKGETLDDAERIALANKIEQMSFANLALDAVRRGEGKKFRNGLLRVINNQNISEETRKYAREGLAKLNTYEGILKKYKGKANAGTLIASAVAEDVYTSSADNIQEYKNSLKDNFITTIDEYNAIRDKEGKSSYTLEEIEDRLESGSIFYGFEEQPTEEEIDFQEYFTGLRERGDFIGTNFALSLLQENGLRSKAVETKETIAWETDPRNEKEIEKRENDKKVKELLKIVTKDNADDVKAELKKMKLDTPEVIAKINEKIINQDNSAGIDNSKSSGSGVEVITEEDSLALKTMADEAFKDAEVAEAKDTGEQKITLDSEIKRLNAERQIELKELRRRNKKKKKKESSKNITKKYNKLIEEAREKYKDSGTTPVKTGKEVKSTPTTKNQDSSHEAEEERIETTPEGTGIVLSQEQQDQINAANEEYFSLPRDKNNESQNRTVDVLSAGLEKLLKKRPDFKFSTYVVGLVNIKGERVVERDFKLIEESWERATGEKLNEEEAKRSYLEVFGPMSEIAEFGNAFSNVSVKEGEILPTNKELKDSEGAPKQKEFNPETGALDEPVYAKHTQRKFAGVGVKIGVLGRQYSEDHLGNKEEEDNEINESAKPYMDRRNFHEGAEVKLVFDFSYLMYPNNIISKWHNLEAKNLFPGDARPFRDKTSTVSDILLGNRAKGITGIFEGIEELDSWEKLSKELARLQAISELISEGVATEEEIAELSNSILFKSEEFLKIVPVGMVNNGYTSDISPDGTPASKIIGGAINDYYWFNNANVALKVAIKNGVHTPMEAERAKRISDNRRLNLATRRALLANGVYNSTVEEVRDAANNTRVLKTEEEKKLGYSLEFSSLFSQFDSNIEEFNKNAALAYYEDGKWIGERDNNGRAVHVKVDGVPITIENTPNLADIQDDLKKRGIRAGRVIFIAREGTDKKGNPTFTAHNMISNHKSKQEDFKKSHTMLSQLYNALTISENDSIEAEEIKKNLAKKFKEIFGYELNTYSIGKLRGMLPMQGKFGNYRQDFKPALHRKGAKQEIIPNFDGFETIQEFLSALSENRADEISINGTEAMLSNLHTNIVFTPIDKNGEKIYTSGSQPIIILSSKEATINSIESLESQQKETITRLARSVETLEEMKKEAKTEAEKKSLDAKIKENKRELEGLNNKAEELGQIKKQVEKNEIKEKEDETAKDATEYGSSEEIEIIHKVLAETLSGFDVTKKVNLREIYEIAKEKYFDITRKLLREGKYREADFMEEVRDKILGTYRKEDSIREYLELVLEVDEDTNLLDEKAQNEKEVGKSSFELDARRSIRKATKLIFFGISDTKSDKVFAGFSSYMTPFEAMEALQQVLSEVNNNSMVEVRAAIKQKVESNPKDLGFYEEILNRLDIIETTNPDIIKELMYSLYQSPVIMRFTALKENDDGTLKLENFDANIRNPQFVKRARWSEQIKLNGLLDLYDGDFFKLNKGKVARAEQLYTNITNSYKDSGIEAVNRLELGEYLNLFGISLNSKTIDNLYAGITQNDINLAAYLFDGKFPILGNLMDTLKIMGTVTDRPLAFKNTNSSREDIFKIDPVTFKNSRLNDLIKADNSVEFIPTTSNYLGGKTVNSRQQPNAITTKVKNIIESLNEFAKVKDDTTILDEDKLTGVLKELKEMPITSNSMLIDLLKSDPEELAKYFQQFLFSLEAFQELGTGFRDDMSVVELSNKDAFLAVMGMYASSEGGVTNIAFEDKYQIKLRKGIIPFPTISDTSQLPLLKTILLNLTSSEINTEVDTLSDSLLDLMTEQLLYPDLLRIADYNLKIGEGTSNISGYDIGSQFISGMVSLNSLAVDVEGNTVKNLLVMAFKKFMSTPEVMSRLTDSEGKLSENVDSILPDIVREFIEIHKSSINNTITNTVKLEADKYISEDGSSGTFAEMELIDENGKFVLTDGKDDNSYYTNKTPRLIAYDFAINYMLQQKEIQTIFAGDMAMYFTDKMGRGLRHGVPIVTTSEMMEEYYPSNTAKTILDRIVGKKKLEELSEEDKNELFENFPQLKFADEFLDADVDANEAYEAKLPIVKDKINSLFKDVQNNLSKRLKGQLSPGNKYFNVKNQPPYLQVMIQDLETISKSFIELASTRYSQVTVTTLKPLVERFTELDNIYNKTDKQITEFKNLKESIKKLVPGIAAYLETAETDAQEYMSWREALDQLDNQGRVPEDIRNSIRQKIENQVKELEENKTISDENRLSERELLYFSGQPTKPLYAGTMVTDINGHKPNRFVYIKSSTFPLLPELTAMMPELDAIRRNVERIEEITGKNVRLSYQSANKVGAVKNAMSISELHKPVGNLNMELIKESSLTLSREGYSIQQDVPLNEEEGKRSESPRATQFEKIILGDGISKITKNIFPAELFDKELLTDLGIVNRNNNLKTKLNGSDLQKIYREIYKREQKLKVEKLFDELDMSSYEDIENGNVATMEALAEKIKDKLKSKQDREALELLYEARDSNGVKRLMLKDELSASGLIADRAIFRFPIFMAPNSRKLESNLLSMVAKNNVNLSIPGYSAPIGSERGFSYKGYSKEALEEAKKNGLVVTSKFNPEVGLTSSINKSTGKTHAQIFLPNLYQFYNRETRKYENVNMNDYVTDGMLDLERVPEDLLSMFSFRIPTSSHQSGMVIEVVGFLPPVMGHLMIVPKDSTIQIGEDFDIDKRYAYLYNLIKDENGDLKKMQYSDIVEANKNYTSSKPTKTFKELRDDLQKAKDELWEEYYETSGIDQRSRLKNPYFENSMSKFYEIILLEDTLANYDVDKLLGAMFKEKYPNREFDEVSKEDIQSKIDEIYNSIIPKDIEDLRLAQLREEYIDLKNHLLNGFHRENNKLKEAWNEYNIAKEQRADEIRVLENNLIAMYKSVYSTNDTEVDNLITSVLSTEFSEDSAKAIDEKSTEKVEEFNIYSYHTQKKVMGMGADGKGGIAKHSNTVTIHSLLQQTDKTLQLYFDKKIDRDTTIKSAYKIHLGNYIFDGKLGKISNEKSKDNTRISNYLMQSQNSATDNQKLEIMGRRNENPTTMGVFSLLQMMGIEDSMIKIKGEDVNISYASMFISQPAIIEFARESQNKKGISPFEETGSLVDGIAYLVPKEYWATDLKGNPIIGRLTQDAKDKLGKELTGQKLYDYLGSKVTDLRGNDAAMQFYVLNSFLTLMGAAGQISDLQKIINIESKGLGISFFDVLDLKDKLKNFNNIKITTSTNIGTNSNSIGKNGENIMSELIGEVSDTQLTDEYIKIDDNFYIKPKTQYGHKIVNSLSLANNLLKPLFPYDSALINGQINEILEMSGLEEGTAEFLELKYEVINGMKDYSYTNSKTLFGDNVDKYHQELFFDDKSRDQESLGSYILRLRGLAENNPNIANILKLPLFRDMQIVVKEKTYPTIIKYNSDNLDNLSDLLSYNKLKNLSESNKELPSKKNGKKMTEGELMKELLMYSFLANQENGAIGFRHLMPIELMNKYKIDAFVRNRNRPSTYVSNFVYNGTLKTVENLLGSPINDEGVIINNRPYSQESLNNTKAIVSSANKYVSATTGQENTFSFTPDGNIIYNYFSGTTGNNAEYTRQYFQHNPKTVKNIIQGNSKSLLDILNYNKISLKDFMDGKMTTFFVKDQPDRPSRPYVVIDMGYQIQLFERYDTINFGDNSASVSHYRRIPLLGTLGFNEYKAGVPVNKSKIESNNFDSSWKPTNILGTSVSDNIDLKETLDNIMKDSTNPYYDLVRVLNTFLPEIDNLSIKVAGNVKGNAKYDSKTKTITINRALADSANSGDINSAIVEELLHAVTTEIFDRYLNVTGIGKTGQLEYTIKEGVAVPAPLQTLISVYNQALEYYFKKHGSEALIQKMIDLSKSMNENTNESISADTGIEEDANRTRNIHEFIAGIFIKDREFAMEMAKTPYLSSGKSILVKFAETLARLFHRLLPEAKKDSMSAHVASSLIDLIINENNNRDKLKVKKSNVPNVSSNISKLNTIVNEVTEDMEEPTNLADNDVSDENIQKNLKILNKLGAKNFNKIVENLEGYYTILYTTNKDNNKQINYTLEDGSNTDSLDYNNIINLLNNLNKIKAKDDFPSIELYIDDIQVNQFSVDEFINSIMEEIIAINPNILNENQLSLFSETLNVKENTPIDPNSVDFQNSINNFLDNETKTPCDGGASI